MNYTVEITKEAFHAIIPQQLDAFKGSDVTEHAETSYFTANGCNLLTVHNFVSNVTQYYIQDINA